MRGVGSTGEPASASACLCVGLGGHLRTQPDVDNARSDDRALVLRMPEFQMHSPPQISGFEHRSTPVAAVYRHQDRLGTEARMPANERFAVLFQDDGIPAILRFHLEHGLIGQIAQVNPAFNFAANNVSIYLIAQVFVRLKHYDPIVRPEISI